MARFKGSTGTSMQVHHFPRKRGRKRKPGEPHHPRRYKYGYRTENSYCPHCHHQDAFHNEYTQRCSVGTCQCRKHCA